MASSLTRLGIPRKRVVVLHNAVRPPFFDPGIDRDAARQQLGIPPDVPIVAMAGRLVPYKRHLDFLEALAALRARGVQAHGVIAGDVPAFTAVDIDPFPTYAGDLRRRASQPDLAGHVTFLGNQPDTRVVLAAADVLAAPSTAEPFPLIVLEGMASGAPVIASDSGGHPEAVEDGVSGLLFPTGNVNALARAMERLLADQELRNSIVMAARRRARAEFSEDRFHKRVGDLYATVAG